MSDNTNTKTILKLKEESISNVIYEEAADFDESISNEAYKKAFHITEVIIDINSRFREMSEKRGTAFRNSGQFLNIIAFTGNRGTGKTSVMLSYMEFLKDYYRNRHSKYKSKILKELRFKELHFKKLKSEQDKEEDEEKYKKKYGNMEDEEEEKKRDEIELMFTGLDYIDASMLGAKNDDILRNILPKMLKKWHEEEKRSFRDGGIVRDEDYSYKKRQIQMLFNNVYKSLKDLNSKQDILESNNDMFMETLENLSLTWNLRLSFQKLVEAYLEIMEYSGSEKTIGRNNHFLVISLDDLDMNIEHGFELLEEIRKYLMVPNVIVLLSADYEQLEMICVNHYTKTFGRIKDEPGAKDYISRLSKEYLEKILPPHCQVPLKPLYQWKAYDQEEIEIEYTQINEEKITIESGTLKKMVQKEWVDFFNMKFSVKSLCLRYCMPATLRELAFWVNKLCSLETLNMNLEGARESKENNITQNIAVYKKNLQWFWMEKFPQMYEKYLSQSDRIIFETINLLEPNGQIATIKNEFIKPSKFRKNKDSLLEILGKRMMGTKEEQTFSAMSIIYFTAKLTGLFIDWHKGANQNQKAEALKDIKQYFDNGIWGDWEKKMIEPVVAGGGKWFIAKVEFNKTNNCLAQTFVSPLSPVEDFVNNNRQALINYQNLLLFFDFISDFNFSEASLDEIEGSIVLDLKGDDNYKGIFALSNIMRPWEDKKNIIEDFQNNLLRMLEVDENLERREQLIEMIDIRKQGKYYIDFPLENIEFLIDVGRKLQEQSERNIMPEMDQQLVKKGIKNYFSIICESLKEYDAVYNTNYKEKFEQTRIGLELRTDHAESEVDLLYMLSKSISRVSVPVPSDMFD